MRDTYTHTEADAARYEATYGRDDYDPPDEYDGEEFVHPTYIPDDVRQAVRRAYLDANLLHGCRRCTGAFWSAEKRDGHEGRCSGG